MSESADEGALRVSAEVIDVAECARCGRDHPGLRFEPFLRPSVFCDRVVAWWATCPETTEPIFLTAEPVLEEEPS